MNTRTEEFVVHAPTQIIIIGAADKRVYITNHSIPYHARKVTETTIETRETRELNRHTDARYDVKQTGIDPIIREMMQCLADDATEVNS